MVNAVIIRRKCSTLLQGRIFAEIEVGMATEQKHPSDADEPTEEEIERQKRSQEKTWKHDESRELSERDEERPLKP